jgi:tetrahydromethanopterin S-methyltransferase subunit H
LNPAGGSASEHNDASSWQVPDQAVTNFVHLRRSRMDQAQVTGPAQVQQILQFVASLFGPIDDVVGLYLQ